MNKEKKEKIKKVEFYYSNNRFIDLLLASNKWIQLVFSKEALVSFFLSLISAFLITSVFNSLTLKDFNVFVSSILLNLSIGLLGLLGFLIGGVAIISGTISNKILININNESKFNRLMNIMFSFYFNGAMIGITLVIFVFFYLCSFTNWPILKEGIFYIGLLISYLFWFTVISAIMLLGTSLRLMLLVYKFEYDPSEKQSEETKK